MQEFPPAWRDPNAYRVPPPWKPPLWDPPLDEPSTLKLWQVFTEFERRPYFSRVWIVQELSSGVGRTAVLCGRNRIDWKALGALAERLWTMHVALDAPYKLCRRYETNHVLYSLLELATTFSSPCFPFPGYLNDMTFKHCQDPRDRFFGTLDLVDWQRFGQTRPVSDYRITPLKLSLDLLKRTVRPYLSDALLISRSLGLRFSPQVLSDIERERSSRGSTQSDTRRWYRFVFEGVCEIEQGADGRLGVDLGHNGSQYARSVPPHFDECAYDSALLAAHGLTLLFTGDKASVLASACVRAGDLIVQSDDSSFLLRRHGNPPRLLIVGAALSAASYTLPDKY